MPSRALITWILTILCFALSATARAETALASADVIQAFQQHCVQCHGKNGKTKGGVNLLEIQTVESLTKDPDLLKDIADVIAFEEMPPEDEPPIPEATRESLVASLDTLFEATLADGASFAHIPIRRMNRFQYNNAVRDLLELNCVVFPLPERMMREHGGYFKPATGKLPDRVNVGSRPLGKSQLIENRLGGVAPFPQDLRAEHGYDNRGDHLSLSPLLMESFLNLSQSILESPDFGPKTCGIWNQFFAPPQADQPIAHEVRQRLELFLTRAFRRPPETELIDRYANHVLDLLKSGEPFPASMKAVASAALASPRFLYLYDEGASDPESAPLDDYELASRLSFFLWGSIPDARLLELAAKDQLSDPAILRAEVDRMLKDEKLKRFCDSFPAQWLQLEQIISSVPNPERFPEFYFSKYRVSMHMMLEPLLLFEAVLIEDRPILELIDPDFTYRSSLLAAAYDRSKGPGRNAVTSIPFERMPIHDRRHGGVITNAAVLTMTSGPERTHPITRGAWMATVIFNDPPDPPPADVPPFVEEPSHDEANLTLRERLIAHRERADCAGCHEKIDPLGFALENYGPTGRWRDTYENGREVDMAGTLFRKHEFADIIDFKDAILAEKDRFARAFAEHLLSFALTRELDAADAPAVDSILQSTKAHDYRIQPLIEAIVLSEPFRSKSNPASQPES